MFKKRIRVAEVAFLSILVMTVLVGAVWKFSGNSGKGTEPVKVKAGDIKEAEGVTVQVGTVDAVCKNYEQWKDRTDPENVPEYFYRTRTAEVTGDKAVTGLRYEKQTAEEQRNRVYYWKLMPEFSKRYVQGSHRVKGSEFSFDLEWYLSDNYFGEGETKYRIKEYVTLAEEEEFLYYYDGLGPKYYEAAPFDFEGGRSYNGSCLCELDGVTYGYVGCEPRQEFLCRYSYAEQWEEENYIGSPVSVSAATTMGIWDFEETCEEIDNRDFAKELSAFGEKELHLTVKKGIYRFGEDGTAECVTELGAYGDGFSYFWLVANEEEHSLTLIGGKGKRLLAYTWDSETGTVEETVLWDATDTPEEYEEWLHVTANNYALADLVTKGAKSYLCRTAVFGSQVNLSVFENGSRVFEGEVLQRESDFEGLDFSMTTNETTWSASITDQVEIYLNQ